MWGLRKLFGNMEAQRRSTQRGESLNEQKRTITCNGCGLTEETGNRIDAIAVYPIEQFAKRTKWFTVVCPPVFLGIATNATPALHQESEEHFCGNCYAAMKSAISNLPTQDVLKPSVSPGIQSMAFPLGTFTDV
jgi:hypothetical protein